MYNKFLLCHFLLLLLHSCQARIGWFRSRLAHVRVFLPRDHRGAGRHAPSPSPSSSSLLCSLNSSDTKYVRVPLPVGNAERTQARFLFCFSFLFCLLLLSFILRYYSCVPLPRNHRGPHTSPPLSPVSYSCFTSPSYACPSCSARQ